MYRRTEAESRILILAPRGRDAQLIAETLSTSELVVSICPDHQTLQKKLREGAAAAILAEEALSPAAVDDWRAWLLSQPPWSDFPLVVLMSSGRPNPANIQKARDLEILGNVTFLERPVRPDTVRGASRAALRARLRQYEMRHRQEALAQANADLEQFALSASHDLREPIRNMAIYSELIADRYGAALDGEGRQLIEYVRTGAVRMGALVTDLLAYSQASTIADAVHSPIDPTPALEHALSNLRESIRESGACVRHDPLPPVRIQEVHLQQLFQNLIANAIKYRSQQPPEISIGAAIEDGYCVYSVSDNGIGIPVEYRNYVFGIFKRLHTATEYPGTGMGLAICRRIVERYRGSIWVESEPGQGANFRFKFPR